MLLSFVLTYGNIKLVQKDRNKNNLEIYLTAIVIWNLYLYLGTEILSVINAVSFWPMFIYWGMINIILMILLVSCLIRTKTRLNFKIDYKLLKKFWLPIITSIIALILAIFTVPYNWDSMTYHLSRIAHWAQNGSVAHYASNCVRQITSPPMAEFVNLHVYVLTRQNDILFNILQCSSYITNAVIIYAIAKKIKCSQTFSYLAMILFLSMPTAFAEALSTQVDQFATLWLLIFVYFLIDFIVFNKKLMSDRSTVWKIILMSASVGFGYLTKPTVSVAMLLLLVWLFMICILRKDTIGIMFRLFGSAIPMVVLIIVPEMIRNIITFSAVSSPVAGQRQLVSTLNPLYLFVNFLKNISMNLPNIFIYGSEDIIFKSVRKISKILHVDMNHQSISESEYFLRVPPSYGHDSAINVTILVFILVCVVLGIIKICKNKKIGKNYRNFSFIAILSFFIICFIFRWNPFISRYMLPFLAIACPAVAVILQKFCEEVKNKDVKMIILTIAYFMCAVELTGSVLYHTDLCFERGIPIRPKGYFMPYKEFESEVYQDIADYIAEKQYTQIGIYMREDDYEYPLWKMLTNEQTRIEHVNVQNDTKMYADDSFEPECIIVLNGQIDELAKQYGTVTQIYEDEDFFVLEK